MGTRKESNSERIKKAEEILQNYIATGNHKLARMSLAALLELVPEHPQREKYEQQIAELERVEKLKPKIAEIQSEVRKLLREENLDQVRAKIYELKELAPIDTVTIELEEKFRYLQNEFEKKRKLEELKERIKQSLNLGEVEKVQRFIGELQELGASRVTVSLYKQELQKIIETKEKEKVIDYYEKLFEEAISKKDWRKARKIVIEMEDKVKDTKITGEMFAKLVALEEEDRKRKAIEDGIKMVKAAFAIGNLAQAEIALRILENLAPDDPEVAKLRLQFEAMRG